MKVRGRHMRAAALLAVAALGAGQAQAIGFGFGGESYPKVQKPASFDPVTDHSGDAGAYIWVNKPGAAKGVSKVIIPFFQIQFVVRSRANATVVGASSTMIANLDGPDDVQMQAIADEVYAHLVAKLRAGGIEVVEPDAAGAFPAWGEMMANMKPSGDKVGGMGGVTSRFMSRTGMGWYLLPTMKPDYAGGGSFSVMDSIGMVRREQALLDQSGAAVLGFRAVVDFASLKSSDKGAFGHHGLFAWTKGKAGIALSPISTQMFLISPNAKGNIGDQQYRQRFELQTPLLIDTGAILAIKDSTSTGQKISAGLGSAISILGGGGMHSVKEVDIKVDRDVWQRDVTGALYGIADMMTARMIADRQ